MSLELDANQEVGSLQSWTQCSQCQSLQSQEVRLGGLVQGSRGVVPPALPAWHTEHRWRSLEPVPGQVDNVPLVLDLVPDVVDEVRPVGSPGTQLLAAGIGW